MNKTVVITGASRGLGLCLTRKYLEEGYTVFAGVRDLNGTFIVKLKEEYKNTFIPVIMEVANSDSVNKAAVMVSQYTDHIDILINNAAIHNETSFNILEEADIDDCLPVYNVNSLGPLRVVKAFLPLLRKSQGAKIINISSESGSIEACQREKEFDYCMSKAALNMATKLLSNYLRKDHMMVLSVHPGWMRTDMGGQNAHFDPQKIACQLVELFEKKDIHPETPLFIDYEGKAYPW